MKYSVYQIALSESDIAAVNADQPNAAYKAKRDMQFDFDGTGIANIAANAWTDGHFGKVCMIEANSMDQVFHIGNVGPESAIDRGPHNTRMASISAGDIIEEDETGSRFVVSNFGFQEVA